MLRLSKELEKYFPEPDSFTQIMNLEGEIFRHKEGRKTLSFHRGSKLYFAKLHSGVGWGEIVKAWLRGNKADVDASPEWRAIEKCEAIGVETMVIAGRGLRGANPAKRQSFLITEALEERLQLDHLGEQGYLGRCGVEKLRLKRQLCLQVAQIARQLHQNGINHRDLYLCHFQVNEEEVQNWQGVGAVSMKLLDLHRAQIRDKVPARWLIKDLGALYFSAIDCGITDRDIVLFLREYIGENWKSEFRSKQAFWTKVRARAAKFYQRHRGKPPQFPGMFASF